jgi:eukaryotic-like serine/threonine-protein kinase
LPNDKDYEFARVAVEGGLLSQEQADALLNDLAAAESLGSADSIAEIAAKRNLLSEDECRSLGERVERAMGKRVEVGGFEILERIGRGGMGAVYRARQLSMDREVALKILSKRLAGNENYVKRFIREARAAAKLDHPNIVQGITVGKSSGYYYFAMEFVDGETVADKVDRDGPMDEKSALNVCLRVAEALEHAHSRANIIHRDVKPPNIMITYGGAVKLADMGLARKAMQTDGAVTYSGVTLGTPDYISPEQIRGEMDLDGRCDIYSLGATLYQLLTGKPPFQGETANVTMAKHLTDPIPDPADGRSGISADTSAIVHKAMQKEKRARFQSAAEMVAAIRQALHRLDANGAAVAHAPHRAQPVHAAIRRHQRTERSALPAILVLAGLLVGIVVMVVYLATRGGDAPLPPPPDDPPEVRQPDPLTREPDDEPVPEPERLSIARKAHDHAQSIAATGKGKPWLILSELEDMLAQCKNTDYESAVNLLLDNARREFRSLAESALADLEDQAAALTAKKRFGEAATVFDRFPKRLRTGEWRGQIQSARKAVTDRAGREWAALKASAEAAARAKDFDRATTLLEGVEQWGVPRAAQQAKAMTAAWQEEAQLAKRREVDQRFRTMVAKMSAIITALKERRNTEARLLADAAAADPAIGEHRDRFRLLSTDIGRIIGLWTEAESRLKAMRPGDSVRVGSILRKFVKYENGKVTGAVSDLSKTVALKEMNEADLFSLLKPYFEERTARPGPLIARGMLYTFGRLRQLDKARRDFAAAAEIGAEDDAKRGRSYIDLIAKLEPEQQAQVLLAQCRDASIAKKWTELAATLKKLAAHAESETYRRNASELTELSIRAAGRGLTLSGLLGGAAELKDTDRVTVQYVFARPAHRAAWRGGGAAGTRLRFDRQLRWDAGIAVDSVRVVARMPERVDALDIHVMCSAQGSGAPVVASVGGAGGRRCELRSAERARGNVSLKSKTDVQIDISVAGDRARLAVNGKAPIETRVDANRTPGGSHVLLMSPRSVPVAVSGVRITGRLDLAWALRRAADLADIAEATRIGTFKVPADKMFLETGLVLEAGKYYHLKASGWWQYGAASHQFTTAAGEPRSMRKRPIYCLLGKAGAETFVAGEECIVGPYNFGKLILGMNEVSNGYGGNSGALTVEVRQLKRKAPPGPLVARGLIGRYYQGTDFETLKLSQLDSEINRRGKQLSSVLRRRDNYSVRWDGYVRIMQAGTYEFEVSADDGFRFYFNGKRLLEDWGVKPRAGGRTKPMRLEPGLYKIQIDYKQHGGGAHVRFQWRVNNTREVTVPATVLYHSINDAVKLGIK